MKIECTHCKCEFNKAPSALSKSGNNFCSRSCAAKYNNVYFPKRKREGVCLTCKTTIRSCNKYCKKCLKDARFINTGWGGRISKYTTLGDILKDQLERYGKRTANCFTGIRGMARTVAFKDRERKCQHCGYDKFVQVCHIKPISDFSIETPLTTINAPENLAILCPNCHKELDHGILKLE